MELARNPKQAARLRGDPEGLKRGATEEGLRFHPGFVELPQKAAQALEAAGHHFEAGDKLVVPFGAVNRDPSRWPDPHRFDITRDADVASLSFGVGPHFCLGQAMARVTLEECLALLFSRYSQVTLAEPPRWRPFVMETKLEALRVVLRR